MVIVYTGKYEIDKILEEEIKGSMAISYLDFIIENEKFENQTAIIAAQEIEFEEFEKFLFALRKLNIRVILLFTSEKEEKEKIKLALKLGIYDLILGNFYPSQIKDVIKCQKEFKDIAELYRKIFNIKKEKNQRKGNNKFQSIFYRK